MKHPIIITSKGKVINRNGFHQPYKANSILSKYLSSPTGRQALAASMVNPIKRRLDYQSLARKIFLVQSLPQGALPIYDKDIGVAPKYKYDAIKIGSDGQIYRKDLGRKLRARKVIFPLFDLYSNPPLKLSDVKRRRFNLIDRQVQKAKTQIMNQEDSMIFNALDNLSK